MALALPIPNEGAPVADYNALARTNYFQVKDLDRFKADLVDIGIHPGTWDERQRGAEFILDDNENNQPRGSIALFSCGPWPSLDDTSVADRLELAQDEAVDLPYESLHQLVASHLVEDSIAVFMEVGFESLRYVMGTAVAVNAAGETKRVDLGDIYEMAAELLSPTARAGGVVITLAEY